MSIYRSGSVKKGDEIIMINGQSVIGLTLKDVVQRLGNSASPVHIDKLIDNC